MSADTLISTVVGDWASLYNNHKAVLGAVMFGHFAGLLVGGGMAISFDLDALRVSRGSDSARATHLARIPGVHRWVLLGLSATIVTGLLMMLADLSTFLHSPAFWAKMFIVGLLTANGALLTRRAPELAAMPPNSWVSMRTVAFASLLLWLAATLAGVVLATTA
jgi:hypothetical protein